MRSYCYKVKTRTLRNEGCGTLSAKESKTPPFEAKDGHPDFNVRGRLPAVRVCVDFTLRSFAC